MSFQIATLALLSGVGSAASLSKRQSGAISYTVPTTLPSNASPQLDAQPIGVSLEFFTFPSYMTNVTSTNQCLSNLATIGGVWPPMRIGGTTQHVACSSDRATYDPSSSAYVTYSVSSPADAPQTLTFGPSFMTLANTYKGKVIIGFNRRLNNIANTIQAALRAKNVMTNLYSIELGNEPNFFTSSDPINTGSGSWSAAKDFVSQRNWQAQVGGNLSTTNIFSAGVYFGTGSYDIPTLVQNEGNSLQRQLQSRFSDEPQRHLLPYKGQIAGANGAGKPHIMGETNSATQGGGGISPTFGAALWVMDYSLQLLYLGSKALYFHQGTIGNCQYCWWGRYSMGAPYYGAYFASLALAGADRLAPLDNFGSNYGGYTFFKGNQPMRVLLYNSDYYTSGTRSTQTFTLSGLTPGTVTARRLSAASATARQDQGAAPSISGLSFQDGTCKVQGTSQPETTTVNSSGQATFTVAASEALLIQIS